MITYVKTMDIKNLISIEPSVVLYKDTDAVGKMGLNTIMINFIV